tara:strand:- start:99 stop:443 length:345 start_codon:yes stop_codon:yes gene_type:complete
MSFFDSEIVQKQIAEINESQEEIVKTIPKLPYMMKEEQIKYFDKMIDLVEKQKLFYVRLSLSDDPRANELQEEFKRAAVMLGMASDTNQDMNLIYESFKDSMYYLRRQTLDGTL